MQTVTVALRDWDWLTPLILREISTPALDSLGVELRVRRVPSLLDPWQEQTGDLFAFETSLARLNRAVIAGDQRVVGLPFPLMQSFRQRCIIVAADSPATSLTDLRGGRIGLTGWVDSGNTWTRAVLLEAGVDMHEVTWIAGRLTADHPETDRLAGFGVPGWIEPAPDGSVMTDLLSSGELDAVMTPFMPPKFFDPAAPWRPLFPDVRGAEIDYVRRTGLVPVHHVLGVDAARYDPELARAVGEALLASRLEWRQRRRKYAETSMWLASDLLTEATELPRGWDEPTFERQAPNIAEFSRQAMAQGITRCALAPEKLVADVSITPPDC